MAAGTISAVSVSGARSATFVVTAAAVDTFNFSALAAALLDPAIGGATGNAQTNALYKFFNDNAASNLAATQAAWLSNGVNVSCVGNAGSAAAPSIGLLANQLVAITALAAGSYVRISLASSISA